MSESGRAIVAYHSVLIFNVLGVSAFGEEKIPESIKDDEAEQPVIDLLETYQNLSPRNALESYHDAAGARHGAQSAAATCRSSSAARPRTSIGPSW